MAWRDRVLDTRPLRASRAYREIWAGSALAGLGGAIANVAVLFQVWQLTRDPLWTGVIGLATAGPMLVFGLLGGSLADTYDRRAVIRVATVGQLLGAAGLLSQALAGNESVGWILALVAVQSGCGGLGAAARRTLAPRLLPRELVPAGIAVQHFSFQVAMLLGPALAGVLMGAFGVSTAFAVQTAAVAVSLLTVLRLPPLPPDRADDDDTAAATRRRRRRRRAAKGGWSAVWARPTVRGSMLTDLFATVLAMPIAIFPLVNEERFGGSPETLGLFLSCIAVGGIGMGLLSGTVTRARRAGLVQLGAAFAWALSLLVFGLVGPLWLALLALVVAGATDTVSVVTRAALVQAETPDRFRGRVSSVEHVIGVAGPDVGNFRGGALASVTSASTSLVIGGAMAAVSVLAVALTHPTLRAYRSPRGVTEGDDAAPGSARAAAASAEHPS